MSNIARRKFLIGFGALLAAPAIVHFGNLMPVKVVDLRSQQIIDDIQAMQNWGFEPTTVFISPFLYDVIVKEHVQLHPLK